LQPSVEQGVVEGLRKLHGLLGELDRSPNGRHEGDAESQDPTGISQGNPYLRPGTRIGTHISGKAIVVPGWRDLTNADAWIQDADAATKGDS
jgi:hypothetical protein